MNNNQEPSKIQEEFDEVYMNKMQIKANLIDSKIFIGEIARAAGKTHGIFAQRMVRVAHEMPRERSFLCHKSYVALLTNVVPTVLTAFKDPIGENQKPLAREGIDFVIGEKDLPAHFAEPRYKIDNPKHSIVYKTGHVFQLAATDQPESVAGSSGVHAFVEELKHNKGSKFKSRVIPALRNGLPHSRKSHLYQGITGISDTARIDLGEDDWFHQYEGLMDKRKVAEIANVALHINEALYNIHRGKNIAKNEKIIKRWSSILNTMRRNSVYFLRASTFVNKDLLGFEFFKTQYESMEIDEFLSSIANIRRKAVTNKFFAKYNAETHEFSDSYIYNSILQLDLRDTFKITSEHLKYCNKNKPLQLGYDPGHFSSIVVSQNNTLHNELRVIKEFTVYYPQQHKELAENINKFFKSHKRRVIDLYFDRAANQKKNKKHLSETDALTLKAELERHKWQVNLKNLGQRTIYFNEHYTLLKILFGEESRSTPRIRIDENECPNLISAIPLSPVKIVDGYPELDKESEKKVALQKQAGLTTQLPSALMYLLFGLFENHLPNKMRKRRSMPDNATA